MTEAETPPYSVWDDFLARHPDLATVDVLIPDLVGIARGKRVSTSTLGGPAGGGVTFPTSVYGIDATGENVDRSGLIWEEGDADRPCRIDWTTLAVVPWRERAGQVIGALGEHDGGPFHADPRAVLAAVAERFGDLALSPVVALELEFHLLDRPPRRGGPPRLATASGSLISPAAGQVYAMEEMELREPFLARLHGYCAAQGLPAKSAISEYAPGQFEVNLDHVGDPVRAADDAFLLKRAVKAAARAEGLGATFMAKPFAGLAGNGLHVHVSLLDVHGENLFARDERAMGRAIAGLQQTMAEAMLLFAPNANSFRRLEPESYAPTAPTWGHNNRTVALRVPAGAADARRIEHRVAGADANPYLVTAAVLAGIHHGLSEALEPDAPIQGNAYAQVEPRLPRTWDRAIETFLDATVVPGYLGEEFCRLYRVCREAERDRFARLVTPTEYAWYLNTV